MQDRTKVTVRCPAKLNLTFEVLGTIPDGYHEVRTLLQSIDLEDEIDFHFKSVTCAPQVELSLSSGKENRDGFPLDSSNLITRAILEFQDYAKCAPFAVSVSIKKNIPIAAGLAGGSANAAAALAAANLYCDNPLSKESMLEIASSLGADVPFSLTGGTAVGTFKGDRLEKVDSASELNFLIIKPSKLALSTPAIFKRFDELAASRNETSTSQDRTRAASDALCKSDLSELAKHLHNDLELPVFGDHPSLDSLRKFLLTSGARAARLTGSGPTLFALTDSREQADQLRLRIEETNSASSAEFANLRPLEIYNARSIDRGVIVSDAQA